MNAPLVNELDGMPFGTGPSPVDSCNLQGFTGLGGGAAEASFASLRTEETGRSEGVVTDVSSALRHCYGKSRGSAPLLRCYA